MSLISNGLGNLGGIIKKRVDWPSFRMWQDQLFRILVVKSHRWSEGVSKYKLAETYGDMVLIAT